MKKIIEFNGLPGTGKTTIANVLQTKLEAKQIKCLDNYSSTNKILFLFDFRCWIIFFKALLFTISISPTCQVIYRAKKFVLFYKMYHDFILCNQDAVLIMDQGILQNVISSIHEGEMTNTYYLKRLLQYYASSGISFLRVDCILDIRTASMRLTNRTHGSSRLDNLNSIDANRALYHQKMHFNKVRSIFAEIYPTLTVVEIDTKKDINYNSDLIINSLDADE